jgi:hypothetical protein
MDPLSRRKATVGLMAAAALCRLLAYFGGSALIDVLAALLLVPPSTALMRAVTKSRRQLAIAGCAANLGLFLAEVTRLTLRERALENVLVLVSVVASTAAAFFVARLLPAPQAPAPHSPD